MGIEGKDMLIAVSHLWAGHPVAGAPIHHAVRGKAMSAEEHPLASYPESEKTEYLQIVASMVNADKTIRDEEIDLLRSLCKTVKVSDKSTGRVMAAAYDPDGVSVNEILQRFSNSDLRFTLVTDVIFMAYADEKVVYAEEQAIKKIASALRINDDQIAAMRKYVEAVRQASKSESSEDDLKNLGVDVAASLAATGVPVAAVAVSGSVFGLSAAGITSGLAALGLGLGMVPGIGVAVGIGIAAYLGVKWLYRKITEG